MTASYTEEHAQAESLRLPDPALLFQGRAVRLSSLAAGSSTEDFLRFLSRIAEGQAAAVREVPVPPVRAPGPGDGAPLPPLDARRVPRDAAWRRMLAVVLARAKAPDLPAESQEIVRRLTTAPEAELEAIASGLLAGELPPGQAAAGPFAGAALQAWFTTLASSLDPAAVAVPGGASATCPVCGSPPVAGVVQAKDRLRYLSCALCAAEWNVSRLHCIVCGKDDDLAYYAVEAYPGAKAEACGRCRVYVKIFDENERAGAEPAADDAATLALDLLLANDGWHRAASNLYLAAGGAEPASR